MTNRRNFIKKTATGAAMAGLLPLSEQASAGEIKLTGVLVHHVFSG
jgi:hypothetical protein